MKISSPFFPTLATALTLVSSAAAFPSFAEQAARGDALTVSPELKARMENAMEDLAAKRDLDSISNPADFKFNADEQLIDVTSPAHVFIAPAPAIFFNRNGVTTLTQAIDAVSRVYGISPDLGGFLSAYAVIFTGNILDLTWSIGGPYDSAGLWSGHQLACRRARGHQQPQRLRMDASVTRQDFYLNNGDGYSLHLPFFQELVDLAKNDSTRGKDVYTTDLLLKHRKIRFDHSIANNPFFFYSPFGGLVVTTAAHHFITNFMASNTANEEGSNRMYLDEANLFPFFSIHRHKNNGTLYHIPGHERIPHNWFRRPLASEFSLLDIVRNVLTSSAAYPEFLSVGGNAGKVNTYAGVNVGDLTGGLLNVAKLTSNQDALSCFLYQGVVQSVIPTQLKFIYDDIAAVTDFLTDHILGPLKTLAIRFPECDKLQVDYSKHLNNYPGHKVGKKQNQGLLGIVGSLLTFGSSNSKRMEQKRAGPDRL